MTDSVADSTTDALASGKTAFVTGGTGFVGLNLVDELCNAGWQVTALHRAAADTSRLKEFPVTLAAGDLTDAASLNAAMPEGVDAVFHVAADTNMWSRNNAQQTRNNVDGTRYMVEAAIAKGAKKFVCTSSVSAYMPRNQTISEDTVSLAGTSWINYERSKWLAEEEVRAGVARGLDAVIINPNAVLGKRDTGGWAQLFFALRDGKLGGLPSGAGVYNHVTQVAKAHIAAAERGRSGKNYILPGPSHSMAEMIQMMADCMGIELKAKPVPPVLMQIIARLGAGVAWFTGKEPDLTPEMAALMCISFELDTDKAERELGFQQTPLKECVEESHAWLVAEGLL